MSFTNLAGRPIEECNEIITNELHLARINISKLYNPQVGEVSTNFAGKLPSSRTPYAPKGVNLRRAWRYWIITGKIMLSAAHFLYDDPAGRYDVRVCGHCGCPKPEDPWITYYNKKTGRKVLNLENKKEYEKFANSQTSILKDIGEAGLKNHEFDDDRLNKFYLYDAFIESYHIDSQVGLRVFSDVVQNLYG